MCGMKREREREREVKTLDSQGEVGVNVTFVVFLFSFLFFFYGKLQKFGDSAQNMPEGENLVKMRILLFFCSVVPTVVHSFCIVTQWNMNSRSVFFFVLSCSLQMLCISDGLMTPHQRVSALIHSFPQIQGSLPQQPLTETQWVVHWETD